LVPPWWLSRLLALAPPAAPKWCVAAPRAAAAAQRALAAPALVALRESAREWLALIASGPTGGLERARPSDAPCA